MCVQNGGFGIETHPCCAHFVDAKARRLFRVILADIFKARLVQHFGAGLQKVFQHGGFIAPETAINIQ